MARACNNVLGFPGLFRGALDAGASRSNDDMLFAAAEALARQAPSDALIPDPLDVAVHEEIARSVQQAALRSLGDANVHVLPVPSARVLRSRTG